MKARTLIPALLITFAATGCATWDNMSSREKSAATGAAVGGVAGAVVTDGGILGTVGGAGGVGIMMTHGSKVIELGVPTTPQAIVAGDNTLEFGAYVQGAATGTIVPGDFSAVTNFTLAYQ